MENNNNILNKPLLGNIQDVGKLTIPQRVRLNGQKRNRPITKSKLRGTK